MRSFELYDYQQEMRLRISHEFAFDEEVSLMMGDKADRVASRALMVQMPTGTGKTYLMAAVIGDVLNKESGKPLEEKGEVWVVTHRRELVEQVEETLDGFGIAHVRYAEEVENGVRVVSIQWLSRHYGDVAGREPALIVIDEAHHALADTYRELWKRFPKVRKLGLTATPCRLRKEGFTSLFGKLLTSWSVDEFIAKGRLSLYDYVVICRDSEDQLAIDSLHRRGADGDYSVSEMEERLNLQPVVERLYQSVDQYASGRKGIVYAISRSHAKRIADFYASKGLRTVAIDSLTPSALRKRIVSDFKEGHLDCMVNVNLFDEGFDCPDVGFIQMARPTLSLAKYMQMVGRGLRVHPSKEMCVLIDNVGLYRLFGLPDAKRDWQAMFSGTKSGRGGCPLRRRRDPSTIVIDNGMERVVNHSLSLSNGKRKEYLSGAEPFEREGRWGLRVGDEIVLRPIYWKIMPFVGDFAAFAIAPERWGILLKSGKALFSPNYRHIELFPDGYALLERNERLTYRFHLPTTYKKWATARAAAHYR